MELGNISELSGAAASGILSGPGRSLPHQDARRQDGEWAPGKRPPGLPVLRRRAVQGEGRCFPQYGLCGADGEEPEKHGVPHCAGEGTGHILTGVIIRNQ